jgi:hypothetical protein
MVRIVFVFINSLETRLLKMVQISVNETLARNWRNTNAGVEAMPKLE